MNEPKLTAATPWSDWTPEQWAEEFAKSKSDDPGDLIDGSALVAELDRTEAAKAKRKARAERERLIQARKALRHASRYHDVVVAMPLFAERANMMTTIATAGVERFGDVPEALLRMNGRPPIRGVEAILATLEAIGITFELSPRGHLLTITRGGTVDPAAKAQVQVVAPLIRAHLAGDPMPCEWCESAAVTLLFPDLAGACETHLWRFASEGSPAPGVEVAAEILQVEQAGDAA